MKNKKNIIPIVSVLALTTIGVVSSGNIKVSADTVNTVQSDNTQDLSKFDSYITVSNNQFVFNNNPQKITKKTALEINQLVTKTNDYIKTNNLIIDPKTKTATQYVSFDGQNNLLRSYGKNGILAIRWNSVRVGLNKGLMNDIIHGGVAGAGFYLGFLAGGPAAGSAVAIATVIFDRHLDTKSGWWFDYNVYIRRVTNFGRQ